MTCGRVDLAQCRLDLTGAVVQTTTCIQLTTDHRCGFDIAKAMMAGGLILEDSDTGRRTASK